MRNFAIGTEDNPKDGLLFFSKAMYDPVSSPPPLRPQQSQNIPPKKSYISPPHLSEHFTAPSSFSAVKNQLYFQEEDPG